MTKRILYKEIESTFSIVKDPIYQLISEYEDIEYIYSNFRNTNKKIFYFSKENTHNILYESEKEINLNEDQDLNNISIFSDKLSELFYLSLSFKNEEYEYTYKLEYINLIYSYLKINENSIKLYKKLTIWKITNHLINNFKNFNESEEDKEKIKEIETNLNNKDLIEKDLELLNKDLKLKISYNDFYQKKIDVIYAEIISSLIENKKFSNYDYCYDIIEQLNLNKVDITKTIYDKLAKVLNKKNEYMREYIINENDLLNETKINFFYIIIKFILKDEFYIYNIDFLYNNFINLKKLLKTELKINLNNKNIIKKIVDLIEFFKLPKKIFYDKNKNIFDDIEKDESKLISNISDGDESKSPINKGNNTSYFKSLANIREEND